RAGLFHGSINLTVFPGYDAALKTGTTNDYRDAWAMGYAPSLAVGVWGFMAPDLLGANLENPADNILHLAVGLWALVSWYGRKSSGSGASGMPM
ncbi:MAG: hypothetical protein HYT41_00685, partial [Candidatus Sungbacteria bacterium]|nr:hypothetical protein [Candidatus Sungbacteria bacterium]